jgi:hypothetical protein
MSSPFVGLDVHFVPPRYDRDRRTPGGCRAAKVTGVVEGTTVNTVSFNRSGLYFGHDVVYDAGCSEWTWHHPTDCEAAS